MHTIGTIASPAVRPSTRSAAPTAGPIGRVAAAIRHEARVLLAPRDVVLAHDASPRRDAPLPWV